MSKRLPWFLLGSAALLFLLLFVPPRTAIFLPGDVSVYLLNAQRMLEGQAIYKDFFQFTPPGTELVYLILFRLLGPRVWVPNVMLLGLGLSLTGLSVFISRKLMRGWAAYLPGVLFLTGSFYNALDASHHWYSVLAVMAAVAVVTEVRTRPRLAAVGVLCGLASFFTQARGVLAVVGFVLFLVWEHRRKAARGLLQDQVCLVSSFLITAVVTNAYFVWEAGLARFLQCIVTFGVRYYSGDSLSNTYRTYLVHPPPLRPWYGLPFFLIYFSIHILVPAVYLLFLVRYHREARANPDEPWDRLMLLSITGLFLFIGIAPAPSVFRLCVVSLPAWIVFAWLLTFPGKPERILAGAAWIFGLLMIVLEPVKVQRHLQLRADLPSGRAAFTEPDYYERYQWISEHTRPGEYFFQADWADTYVALALRNPTPMPFVTNTDYTPPEQVQEVLQALEARRVRLVLWTSALDIPREASPASDHLGPLRADLRSHYHVVKTFAGGDQIWERTASPP